MCKAVAYIVLLRDGTFRKFSKKILYIPYRLC